MKISLGRKTPEASEKLAAKDSATQDLDAKTPKDEKCPKMAAACAKEPKHVLAIVLRHRGLFLTLIACALLAVINISARKTVYFNGSEQATFIYLFQITSMLIFCKIKNVNILGASDVRCLLSGRAMLGVVGLITWNFSVLLIPPSDSIALINTNVIVTAFFARIFLKEKFTIAFLVSIVLAVSGIILITQPGFLFNQHKSFIRNHTYHMHLDHSVKCENMMSGLPTILGITFALTSAVSSGLLPIVMKRLQNKNIHFSVVILYAPFFGLPIAFILSIFMHFFKGPTKIPLLFTQNSHDLPYQLLFLFIVCSCTLIMQSLNYIALRYDEASKIGIIRSSSEVLFTFIAQYLFLNIDTNILRIVGGSLIVTGSVLVVLFKLLERMLKIAPGPASVEESPELDSQSLDQKPAATAVSRKSLISSRLKKVVFLKI